MASSSALHDVGDSCSLLVSLPVLVPYGVVVKQDTSPSASYVFSHQFPSARALLSRASDTCDMFVGQLQVDLVSFTCKRTQVPQAASVFNRMARKKLQQLFERPIYIRCEGLKQRSVSTVGVGGSGNSQAIPHDVFIGTGQQRVYFTAVDVLTNQDREKFWAIESFVESYVEKLKELRLMNPKTVARTPDLFVVVRRFLCDPLPYPLSHYDQYACDGVQLSEVRLVFSKGTSQCPVKHVKIDPRFKNVEVSCRPIVCDTDSRPARYEFANVMLPPVFASSTSASAYLDSLSLEDDREAARILLESDSKSGGSNNSGQSHDECNSLARDIDDGSTAVETTTIDSMYSPRMRSLRDDSGYSQQNSDQFDETRRRVLLSSSSSSPLEGASCSNERLLDSTLMKDPINGQEQQRRHL